MFIRSLLLVLAILPFSPELHSGLWDNVVNTFTKTTTKAPSIRVLIIHDAEKANLEVQGKYSLFDPYTNTYISTRFTGKSREIEGLHDGLKWGEAFPGLYQLKIRPDEPKTMIMVDGKGYKGNLYIYDIGKTISVVNQIPIEDYVRSTLGAFDPETMHPEALAALAIAARTDAYFQAVNPKNTYWAVDAKKVGFSGIGGVTSDVNEAVRVTRYMIMSRTGAYEGGATPFASQFSSKNPTTKDAEIAKISLEEANKMAQEGEHAAKILAKAFPGSTIRLLEYSN